MKIRYKNKNISIFLFFLITVFLLSSIHSLAKDRNGSQMNSENTMYKSLGNKKERIGYYNYMGKNSISKTDVIDNMESMKLLWCCFGLKQLYEGNESYTLDDVNKMCGENWEEDEYDPEIFIPTYISPIPTEANDKVDECSEAGYEVIVVENIPAG